MTSSPWIVGDGPAAFRLFCLPYAGGGASIFRDWQAHLPAAIRLCRIQLPGRETRFDEEPFQSMTSLVDALISGLDDHLDKPFAIFGHSMGGSIAAELTRRLIRERNVSPRHLFVSASRPPHTVVRRPIHALPGPDFSAALRRDGGTPDEVLRSAELMEIFTPILRADHAIVETWHREPPEPLPVPITCFAGTQDTIVPHRIASEWRLYAMGSYRQVDFPAGHFFIRSHVNPVIAAIVAEFVGTAA
ncbi:MAG: alpha/beta fold hydrolase [Rhodospirillales bacterium]|nr:alpha/beta fold hydrolase [Rhodospirillales bacterium]